MPAAALAMYQGIDRTLTRLPWEKALVEGRVSSDLAVVRARIMRQFERARDLTQEEIQGLQDLLISDGLSHLVELQLGHDQAFLEAVLKIYRDAVTSGTEKPFYTKQIKDLAQRWGAGDVADTWLESAIVLPFFHKGQLETLTDHEVLNVVPYLVHRDMADGRVRHNHLLLRGFMARSDWSGWQEEVLPPHGWGCRCWVEEVYWDQVDGEAGVFGRGSEQILASFRAAGGNDFGFPRSLFVAGAIAA